MDVFLTKMLVQIQMAYKNFDVIFLNFSSKTLVSILYVVCLVLQQDAQQSSVVPGYNDKKGKYETTLMT